MIQKITHGTTTGIDLNSATYENDIITYPGITITNAPGLSAVSQSGASYTFVIDNAATIQASVGGYGISLTSGGTVTNLGRAAIIGGASGDGVYIAGGSAYVDNNATISGGADAVQLGAVGTLANGVYGQVLGGLNGVYIGGSGVVTNSGTITASSGVGIDLQAGGSVTNADGTTVNRGVTAVLPGLISGTSLAIDLLADGTVSNAGSIVATSGTAVSFLGTGANRMIVVPGSTITGVVDAPATSSSTNTLELASAATTGTLRNPSAQYVNFGQITIDTGATWALASGVTVGSGLTLTNSGTLDGPLNLGTNASAINTTGGVISNTSGDAVYSNMAGVSITNAGSIASTGGGGYGIDLRAGGTITNSTTGAISGKYGIRLTEGGTVAEAGTITGTNGVAIYIAGGNESRVILYPGFSINGLIQSLATPANTTLELASAASAGTLTALGNQYTGFGQITLDAGAAWTFAGSNTLDAGATLNNSGTLTIASYLMNAGLLNAALTLPANVTIANTGGTIAAPSGDAIYSNYAGISVTNTGTISAPGNLGFGLNLRDGGAIDNQTGGTILASFEGVFLLPAGTVVNDGSINGNATGIYLHGGGAVTNTSHGIISGKYGIQLRGAGTVANAGTIIGQHAPGILFDNGGANRLIMYPGATITGGIETIGGGSETLELASATATGTLAGGYGAFAQVTIDSGATWSFAAGGGLAGNSTIVNSGTFTATGSGTVAAFVLPSGAFLTNTTAGVIGGTTAGISAGAGGTVINSGMITATNSTSAGVTLTGGGTITNTTTGTITGHTGVSANGSTPVDVYNYGSIGGAAQVIALHGGGSITNGGLITGEIYTGGVMAINNLETGTIQTTHSNGLYLLGTGPQIVTNAGLITSSSANGVRIQTGGNVSNASTGTITGQAGGVVLSGTAGILTNLGGVTGRAQHGVFFTAGGTVDNNATAASITGKQDGIYIKGSPGTVTNQGSVTGSTANGILLAAGGTVTNSGVVTSLGTSKASGISLSQGGYISNASHATITGSGFAIYGSGTASSPTPTLVNAGLVSGTGHYYAIKLRGGDVSNQSGGSITGIGDIYFFGGAGTVTNDGAITSTNPAEGGIGLASGGTITNEGTGSISAANIGVQFISGSTTPGAVTNTSNATISGGAYGVYLGGGGTLASAGTITGGATAAVFGGTGSNRLVLDPGFSFGSGNVVGSPSATNTIELASAASTGTLTGLGSQFTNFGAIDFDAASQWSISGNTAGLSGTIAGFAKGDIIDVTGVTVNNTGSAFNGTDLTFGATGGTVTLDIPSGYTLPDFTIAPSADGTDITVACFAEGTRLLTATGEIPVENLQPGTLVLARNANGQGLLAPIKWIGHRTLHPARHPNPDAVHPIRVAAHAFGPNQPHRDLYLSPDHAVFADNVLIPIHALANGATIARVPVETITYFHVELDSHAIVLAENLPCESYLDTGNRHAFANAGPAMRLHPDFGPAAWSSAACAPLVLQGPLIETTRRAVLAVAESLGHATTTDPALTLLLDGTEILPDSHGPTHRFPIPTPATIRLRSRTAIPNPADPRRLGIAVAAMTLSGTPIPLTAAALGAGWHAPEPAWRWTDGDAELHLPGPGLLEITIGVTETYWQPKPAADMPRTTANG